MTNQAIDKSLVAEQSSPHLAQDDEATDTSGKPGEPTSDLVQFQRYLVNDILIFQKGSAIYDDGKETLRQYVETKSRGFEWVLLMSWINETTADNTYTVTTQEGLTIREGIETENHFGVSASFKGLGAEVGGSRKYFTESESSRATQIEKKVTVVAKKSTYFYQKLYHFAPEVWFWSNVYAWPSPFGIGKNVTYETIKRFATVDIMSNEFATLHRELEGVTTISAVTPPGIFYNGGNRQFDNISKKAKDHLKDRGITG